MMSGFLSHLQSSNAAALVAASRVLSAQNIRILSAALEAVETRCLNPNTEKYGQILSNLSPSLSDLDLEALLKSLSPWRKGPFQIRQIYIDSEWRSEMKWNRILPHLPDLSGKSVLDIGGGNGYYALEMAKYSPRFVLNCDPSWLCYSQFHAIKPFFPDVDVFFMPLGIEHLDGIQDAFQVIFCMGVLYHRRSPVETLKQLRTLLKPKGHLILETLIAPGDGAWALCPYPTYAKMPNVHFLPTLDCLTQWVRQAGFGTTTLISDTMTTPLEQRATAWSAEVESLAQFLDPDHPHLTVEGYPAPRRVALCIR
jgi:tRNA (mo5U34)-methyltransferase